MSVQRPRTFGKGVRASLAVLLKGVVVLLGSDLLVSLGRGDLLDGVPAGHRRGDGGPAQRSYDGAIACMRAAHLSHAADGKPPTCVVRMSQSRGPAASPRSQNESDGSNSGTTIAHQASLQAAPFSVLQTSSASWMAFSTLPAFFCCREESKGTAARG